MESKTIYLVLKDDRDHWAAYDVIGWTDDKAEAESLALALSKIAYAIDLANSQRCGYTMRTFEQTEYREYYVKEVSRLNNECLEEAECSS